MFKPILHLSELAAAVAHKREFQFLTQPNGVTFVHYLFMDASTFDSPASLECRGIAFDTSGRVVSRPLHKFFNAGENDRVTIDALLNRTDIAAIYEKLDGSMIATAWIDGKLSLRSKVSFDSDVVERANAFLNRSGSESIKHFAENVARSGLTAIFEFTSPEDQIVVVQDQPALRLLHVRDNVTGEYLLLNPSHSLHAEIAANDIPKVPLFGLSIAEAIQSLASMEGQEGYVVQFSNGDMVKVKCPWYLRLHQNLAYLHERDIARLALQEKLDDLKGRLAQIGIDMASVTAVETRLKLIMSTMVDEIEVIYFQHRDLDRKNFALANKDHPLFSLAMQRYLGVEMDLRDWYLRNRLDQDFGKVRLPAAESTPDAGSL